MRIYINGRFLTQSITGVQRYAIEFVKVLDAMIPQNEFLQKDQFYLLAPQQIKQELNLIHIQLKKLGSLEGHLWEQFELPFYTKDGFLINLGNTAPILKQYQVVTIHDAAVYAYPQGFSIRFRCWYKVLFWILGKKLKKVITVSSFSKAELHQYCKIPMENIVPISLGVDHILRVNVDDTVVKKYDLQEKNFVFAVSSMNPNKNVRGVLDVARLNPKITFVIAGGENPKVFHHEGLEFPTNVKYIGRITDEELVGLYKHAGCFLYPSLYEGFGLPPLEAMMFGCPVIVSNKASLPEVCGDAAIYCDPHDVNDIGEKIRLLLSDEILAKHFSEKGIKHAEKFRWDHMTKRIIDQVRQLCQ